MSMLSVIFVKFSCIYSHFHGDIAHSSFETSSGCYSQQPDINAESNRKDGLHYFP